MMIEPNPVKVAVVAMDGRAQAELCEWLEELPAEDRDKLSLHLCGSTGGAFEKQAAALCCSFSALDDWSRSGVFAALDRLVATFGPDVIHLGDFSPQRHAVWWQLLHARPLQLIRSWHPGAESPKPGGFNRWRYNRKMALNLFADPVRRKAFSQPGLLLLDNSVVLDASPSGRAGRAAVLCHSYIAIARSTRSHRLCGVVHDASHLRLSYVTHFYCNQKNIDSVVSLLRRYETYGADVLDRLHFVIVDDGSPVTYEVPEFRLNLTWLRVARDIPWNQAGARNLGVTYAKSDAVLLTDLDHEFPEATLAHLIRRANPGKTIYKFHRRKQPEDMPQKAHPNLFFFSRGHFMRHGGYDEEFAGKYGAEDVRFIKYHKAQGTRVRHLPRRAWCFERRDIDRGEAYHSLARDLSLNSSIDARKRFELDFFGGGSGHSRAFLGFDWSTVKETWRPAPASLPLKRWWIRAWLWRQVFQP